MKNMINPLLPAIAFVTMAVIQPVTASPLNSEDMDFAFDSHSSSSTSSNGDSKKGVAKLSNKEMKGTKGNYWWQYLYSPNSFYAQSWSSFQKDLNHIESVTSQNSGYGSLYSYTDNYGYGYNTYQYNPYASYWY